MLVKKEQKIGRSSTFELESRMCCVLGEGLRLEMRKRTFLGSLCQNNLLDKISVDTSTTCCR